MFSHEQYVVLRDGAGLIDRRSRGRLELTGPDRRSYLQGLLTNDIEALNPGTGCYAALLTPQGRMISDMRVSELGDRILLDLPEATAATVRQRLGDFIFSEDVEVRDASTDLVHFGIYGPRAADVLAMAVGHEGTVPLPVESLQALPLDWNFRIDASPAALTVVASDDLGVRGFELFVPVDQWDRTAVALYAAGAADVDPAVAQVARIEAGRPEFGRDMDDHTIPLEAGIEERAISHTKGCYVGQEVIVRVLHRGHGRVARRLVGMVADPADGPLAPGLRIESDGKSLGSITSAADSPTLRRPVALGYVARDFAEPGRVLQVSTGEEAAARRLVTVVTTPFVATAAE